MAKRVLPGAGEEEFAAWAEVVEQGPVQGCEEGPLPGPSGAVGIVLQPLSFQLEAPLLGGEGFQHAQQAVLEGLGVGQAFVQRQDLHRFQGVLGALGEQVVGPQGLDLVAPQLRADRVVHAVAEHVQDSPAHREGSHLLAQGFFAVPESAEPGTKLLQVGQIALAEDEGFPSQRTWLGEALRKRAEGGHHQAWPRGAQGVEGGEAAFQRGSERATPFVGFEFQGGEGQDRIVAQEGAQIVAQSFHLARVAGDHERARMLAAGQVPQRDGHRRGRSRKPRHHAGRAPGHQGAQGRKEFRLRKELAESPHGMTREGLEPSTHGLKGRCSTD